jgi:hypothetical protein
MIVEDFIMLGRTEPQESKKHGITVCSAGYSKELNQFLRIYPLPMHGNYVNQWSISQVPLRRPKDDNRHESWRINSGSSLNQAINALKVLGNAERKIEFDFLLKKADSSISEINRQKRSLAIIKPDEIYGYFERRQEIEPYGQMLLFKREVTGLIHRNDIRPKLRIKTSDGYRNISLLEWGCAEFLRKHRNQHEDLWNILKIGNKDYEHLLFIGNMNAHRNNWVVISCLYRKITKQFDLMDILENAA